MAAPFKLERAIVGAATDVEAEGGLLNGKIEQRGQRSAAVARKPDTAAL